MLGEILTVAAAAWLLTSATSNVALPFEDADPENPPLIFATTSSTPRTTVVFTPAAMPLWCDLPCRFASFFTALLDDDDDDDDDDDVLDNVDVLFCGAHLSMTLTR